MPVQRPRHRVGDGVGDRAVVLVPGVKRRDVVVAALEDRACEQFDPLGHDRPQVRVDHDECLGLQGSRHLEQGSESGTLAADAVHLGVGQADALEPVGGMDEQDLLDIAGRLGFHHDALGSVRGSRVGIDENRPQIREELDESSLRRANHVPNSCRVPIARDADHDVGTTETGDLVLDCRS